jgi:hypothetical protein
MGETTALDEKIAQLEDERARLDKVHRIEELEKQIRSADERIPDVEPEPDEPPTSAHGLVALHPVHCDACGLPYGSLQAPGAVALCRDKCTHDYLQPDPRRQKRGAERREVASEYLEHRPVFCNVCLKNLGHVRMILRGAPTPAVFCSSTCIDEWERRGKENPTGGGRGR